MMKELRLWFLRRRRGNDLTTEEVPKLKGIAALDKQYLRGLDTLPQWTFTV